MHDHAWSTATHLSTTSNTIFAKFDLMKRVIHTSRYYYRLAPFLDEKEIEKQPLSLLRIEAILDCHKVWLVESQTFYYF